MGDGRAPTSSCISSTIKNEPEEIVIEMAMRDGTFTGFGPSCEALPYSIDGDDRRWQTGRFLH